MRLRLQAKALLFFGLLMALGLGAALIYGYRSQRTVLVETSEHLFLTIADNLADEIFRNYEIDDWRGLQSYMEHFTARDKHGVVTVAVIDTTGTVVAAAPERLIDRQFNQPKVQKVIAARKPWVSVNRAGSPWTIEILAPVTSESVEAHVKAVVCVVGSLQSVQDGLQSAVHRQVIVFLIVTGAGFLFTLAYVRKSILRPIRELSSAIQRVVAGDFHKLATRKTHDEIGELASSFDWMAEELRKSQEYLQGYNRTLMQMVAAEQDRNQLDRVISSIAYALIEIDNHGDICRWNKAAADIFGLPPASVLGRSLRDSGIPWDWSQVAGLVDGSSDDNQSWHRDEIPYTRSGGTPGYLAVTMSRVEHTNASPGEYCPTYVLLAADVTERKRAQEALRESEARFRAVLHGSPVVVAHVDRDSRYTWICNPHPDFAPASVLGKRDDEIAVNEGTRQLVQLKRRVIETGSAAREEISFPSSTGETIYDMSLEPLRDDSGNVIGATTAAFDITGRKHAEEALLASKAQLSNALKIAHLGHWEYDVASDLFTFNDQFYAIFRTTAGQVGGYTMSSAQYAERFVHPDDMVLVGTETQKALETTDPAFSRQLEHRIIYADGTTGYINVRFFVVKDAQGRTIKTFGANQDITERKQAELARAKTLERQEWLNQLQQALLGPGDLAQKLKMITDGVVDIFSADFCRIWITGHGDLCELGCMHVAQIEGPHVCRHRDKCLRLMASSGRYTHTDGAVHRRVPFGAYKIGCIASGKEHQFLTNDVVHDPRVHNHDWANELGLVSFAGYQLRPLGGETLGVLALFSKQPITPEEDAQLDTLSSTTAQVIRAARAEDALRASEEKYRALFESSPDAIMTLSPEKGFITGNQAAAEMFGCRDEQHFTSKTPDALSPEYQPDGALSSIKAQEMMRIALDEGSHFFEWTHSRADGTEFFATVLLSRMSLGGRGVLQATVRDISEGKRVEMERARLAAAVEQASESIIITDAQGAIQYVNPAFEWITGLMRERAAGRTAWSFFSAGGHPSFEQDLQQAIQRGKPWSGRLVIQRESGKQYHEDATVTPICDASGAIVSFAWVGRDITQQMALETQLHQAQKLEAVGSLAAGIAHEINTPIQFVGDNVRFLSDAFGELTRLLQRTDELVNSLGDHPELSARVKEFIEAQQDADLGYLKEEVPRAVEQTLDGVARVAKIVRAMKDFSHPDQGEKGLADLNRALQSTLTVAHNELKYVADVVTDFDLSLSSVWCHLGDLNQVFLNLLVNAAHAIAAVVGDGSNEKGTITVTTRCAKITGDPGRIEGVTISIADTGTGIPEGVRDRVFEQFFTTKEVGRGTGQGLAIARAVVVEKHGGRIWFDTEMGKGTTFHVYLPVGAEELVEAT